MATHLTLNGTAVADAMVRNGIDSNSQLARLTGIDRAHLGQVGTPRVDALDALPQNAGNLVWLDLHLKS